MATSVPTYDSPEGSRTASSGITPTLILFAPDPPVVSAVPEVLASEVATFSRSLALSTGLRARPERVCRYRSAVGRAGQGRAEPEEDRVSRSSLNVTGCLAALSERLTDAAAIARAASVCAQSGAERIAPNLDALLNEAGTLHGAVCLLAYRLQADALGGLDRETRRALDRLD